MSGKNNAADGRIAGVASSTRARGHGRWLFAAMFATGLASVSMIAFADDVGSGDAHQGAGTHAGTYVQVDVAHLKAIVHDLMAQASPEQKEKIVAIAHAAKQDLDSMTEQAMTARRQKFGLLLQDTFDRPALERAQASERQAADQISKRIDHVLADLAELTWSLCI